MTHLHANTVDSGRYAQCIAVSKRIRWDIDGDVIRGRRFDFGKKFLPDGLSKVNALHFLTEHVGVGAPLDLADKAFIRFV